MRKKVDSRVRVLVENGVRTRNRSLIMIVGDKGKEQIVNLHYMLSKASVKARPNVLWCYNNRDTLGFSTHARNRNRQAQKQAKSQGVDEIDMDPFSLFLSCTDIRFCYYKDSHKILGTTFGCLVLQDFESLTPNLLARTIETVEGGGLVIFLMKTMTSLKQLYSMSMDVHSRFRTESHQELVPRFNERFLLSLSSCQQFLAVDDELNILPLSSAVRSIQAVPASAARESNPELAALQENMKDTPPIGELISKTVTLDQAKVVLQFLETISEKSLRNTVTLTAARGRGKSAALGISVAGAIAYGYANIFVTAPSPDNLKTFFEMVLKGFDGLGLVEHIDYEAVQSTNPEFGDSIVRINVFRDHRQTIQYIHPKDHMKLAQAEILVIDEAAAIPLPVVKDLLGPYIVFMSSTINGYEGTGRSLSLKLIKQLRQQTVSEDSVAGRTLKELSLEEPIRYALGDPVEKWLNDLLCLDCTGDKFRLLKSTPHPSECELYYVNRDTLFSFHDASEEFLHRMMSLFVSSHYKNTPNDLQLMSDAPAHHLFALLGPVEDDTGLPDILAVIQVCLEGEISRSSAQNSLQRGMKKSGDLIPWTISQQFQDYGFASLSGARIVRIAVHPDVQKMGYGSRALELLSLYYQGKFTDLCETSTESTPVVKESKSSGKGLLEETIAPRKSLPPLLEALTDRPAERLDYFGTSFGVTEQLFNFWQKSSFQPLYLRQTPNDLTGEYSCIMLKAFEHSSKLSDSDWTEKFFTDFRKRFMVLLSYSFASFTCKLSLQVLSYKPLQSSEELQGYSWAQMQEYFTQYDYQRLSSYSRNMIDYHMILDLLPAIASLVFTEKIPVTLSHVQAAILVSLGLQRKSVTDLEKELGLLSNQILAAFNKTVRKICGYIKKQQEAEIELAEVKPVTLEPIRQSLDDVLDEGASKVMKDLKDKQRDFLDSMNLDQYAVGGSDKDWEKATDAKNVQSVSIKTANNSSKKRPPKEKKKQNRDKKHKSKK